MNEHELSTVLERAADRLDPDVAALVAGAAQRGRSRLRRRRAATVAALGTAAALIVGGLAGQPWQSGGDTVADPATVAPGPLTPENQRTIPDDDALVQRLLDHLPAGEVTDVTTTPMFDEPDAPYERGLEIGLLVDGAAVEVRISDGSADPEAWARSLEPGAKPEGCDASLVDADQRTWNQAMRSIEPGPELTPEMICRSWVSIKREQKCAADPVCLAKRTAYSPKKSCGPEGRQLPDGSWLWPRSGAGGDGSDTSGFTGNWASICTPDGWSIDVSAFNSPEPEEGEPKVVSDEPPLSLDQVTELATAGFWFE
ncbi:hypothetical protein [Nocardioides sp. L-11A]|uniref:hypothetical protein n=1 Tax=Nocardioides sp. L-11A TaxID=3043848 RepID=UPI00249CE2DC|nr:hypothetical protein QJ852_19935 [Nocardioides sp. L-11A]